LRWADCTCTGGGGGGSALGPRLFAVVNQSTVVSDDDVQAMTDAVATQVSDHAAPAWGVLAASVEFFPGGVGDVSGGSELVQVLDDTDIPADAGYHTVDGSDTEIIKVFAKTITDGGGGVLNGPGGGLGSYCVARVLSHEVLETFIDPKVQLYAEDFGGHVWMMEVGDVANPFGYDLGGVTVSDFGLPEWWDSLSTASSYSYDDNIPGPFSL